MQNQALAVPPDWRMEPPNLRYNKKWAEIPPKAFLKPFAGVYFWIYLINREISWEHGSDGVK